MSSNGNRKHFVNKFSPDQVKLSSKVKQTNLQLKTFCSESLIVDVPNKTFKMWDLAAIGLKTGSGVTPKRRADEDAMDVDKQLTVGRLRIKRQI